jgi:hypothetical protein
MSIDGKAATAAPLIVGELDLPPSGMPGLTQALGSVKADADGQVLAIEAFRELEQPKLWIYLQPSFRALQGSLIRSLQLTLQPIADGQVAFVRLNPVRAYAGASVGDTPAARYLVWTGVAEGGGAELERWYDEEHMPALAAVPGVVQARRYKTEDAAQTYFACYDLTAPDVVKTPAWLSVRATSWSDRVRPTFRNPRRIMTLRLTNFDVR